MSGAVTLRQPMTFDECQQVRKWRNDPFVTPMLRTGSKTWMEQTVFYVMTICNQYSPHEFYAVDVDGTFAGMGGLTHLDKIPGETEISLIIGPEHRGNGVGSLAVSLLIEQARLMGLKTVTGECYATGALWFWTREVQKRPASMTWRWEL